MSSSPGQCPTNHSTRTGRKAGQPVNSDVSPHGLDHRPSRTRRVSRWPVCCLPNDCVVYRPTSFRQTGHTRGRSRFASHHGRTFGSPLWSLGAGWCACCCLLRCNLITSGSHVGGPCWSCLRHNDSFRRGLCRLQTPKVWPTCSVAAHARTPPCHSKTVLLG